MKSKRKSIRKYVLALCLAALCLSVVSPWQAVAAGENGFVPYDGSFRYYENGVYVKNEKRTIEGHTYYFMASGKAASGLSRVDGMYHYFDPETKRMQTGLVEVPYEIAGETVYKKHVFLPEGPMAPAGWNTVFEKVYYCIASGGGTIPYSGAQMIDGKFYYFDPVTCVKQEGPTKLQDGRFLLLNPNGGLLCSEDNKPIEWQGNTYYALPLAMGGGLQTGLASLGSKLYYFDSQTGAAWKNKTTTIGHLVYTFGEDGAMTSVKAQTGYENSTRTRLILEGLKMLGEPYALEKESGYSCGFFVRTAFEKVGITIPTASHAQAYAVVVNAENGREITKDELRIGDVVYWKLDHCGDPSCGHWREIHHVAIYMGGGKMLESAEYAGGVCVDLTREYTGYKIMHYVRYIDETNDPYVDEINDYPRPQPVTNLKAATAGKSRVALSWSASPEAEGYLIYAQKNGSYGYVGMTKNTSFTDTRALFEDYNFYWVFPYVYNAFGKMIPGGCTKYVFAKGICTAVTGYRAASNVGRVALTWNASPGAEGYLIYGIRPGDSYKYLGMTSGTTWYDIKASKTDWNFYWVFPYFKDDSGAMIVGLTGSYVYGKAR